MKRQLLGFKRPLFLLCFQQAFTPCPRIMYVPSTMLGSSILRNPRCHPCHITYLAQTMIFKTACISRYQEQSIRRRSFMCSERSTAMARVCTMCTWIKAIPLEPTMPPIMCFGMEHSCFISRATQILRSDGWASFSPSKRNRGTHNAPLCGAGTVGFQKEMSVKKLIIKRCFLLYCNWTMLLHILFSCAFLSYLYRSTATAWKARTRYTNIIIAYRCCDNACEGQCHLCWAQRNTRWAPS